MNKQIAGILFIGLTFCMSSKAKPIDGSTETVPKGIHRVADTRLRVVSYNGYWTSIFPRDNGEVRTSEWIDGKGIDGEARLRRFAAWAPKAHADIWAMQEVNPSPRQLNSKARGTYGEVAWSGEVGTSTPQPPTRTIDHILAPKGFMEIQQAFIFNSLILPEKTLAQYGVEREAILLSREGRHEKIDHLPVFMDLK